MWENDARHGVADLGKERADTPDDLKHIYDDVEFVEYYRGEPFRSTMVLELVRRDRRPHCLAPAAEVAEWLREDEEAASTTPFTRLRCVSDADWPSESDLQRQQAYIP